MTYLKNSKKCLKQPKALKVRLHGDTQGEQLKETMTGTLMMRMRGEIQVVRSTHSEEAAAAQQRAIRIRNLCKLIISLMSLHLVQPG